MCSGYLMTKSQQENTSGKEGLHIVLISVHGLIRGSRLELGRDADTGGQILYVVELARALAQQPGVERVDLLTRRVVDSHVSADYAKQTEPLDDKSRIIRIEAGPEEYICKEQLWDHLDSFTDNLVEWIKAQPRVPDIVHSHYADAGYVGARLAAVLGVPLVHTGHSLGRVKRRRLLAVGGSAESAHSRGVRVDRVKVSAFILCGVLAAFGGVLEAGRPDHRPFGRGQFLAQPIHAHGLRLGQGIGQRIAGDVTLDGQQHQVRLPHQ